MDQCEDSEDGAPPSKTTLCGDQEVQTKGQRSEQKTRPDSDGPGPGPSCMSMKSDWSMDKPVFFKHGHQSADKRKSTQVFVYEAPGPGPSCVSMKSDWSMDKPVNFKDGLHSADEGVNQQISEVLSGQSVPQNQTHLDSIFMVRTVLHSGLLWLLKKHEPN
ncbi:uncharacterized protein KZ484_008858 [Pholidichthys leucotaenia]